MSNREMIHARDIRSGVLLHSGKDTHFIDMVNKAGGVVSVHGYPYMRHGMAGTGRLHLDLKPDEVVEITPSHRIFP